REQVARFDEEAWASAQAEGSLAAFERYLEEFPDGRYVIEADALASVQRTAEAAAAEAQAEADRIDGEAFTRALAAGTTAALDDYLTAFPGGRHVEEALQAKAAIENAALDDAAWAAAQASDERSAYEAYVSAFPRGRHLAEALAAVERLTLRPGKVFRDCEGCPEMVVIPAGSFEQGATDTTPLARSNERPARTVRIARPFAMGVHEVTFAEWDRCTADGACRRQPIDNGWGRGQRPVIMVSWADAQDFLGWLSERAGMVYDLPSESEWEYVARAGDSGTWVGGAPERVCDHGNVAGAETGFEWRHGACSDPFSLGTAEVGYFTSNAMGVHDMVGNVAEWTRDCMNLSYLDAPADGSAWQRGLCSSRVTRGGSWFSGSVEIRFPARFALRNGESNDFTGLRVVRAVDE
ncbi:MAG: SUMF1/EgtB/PvdO family nonheme iron enzyme, partial [Pseudomonadota bacterium]